jgi:copper chaperone
MWLFLSIPYHAVKGLQMKDERFTIEGMSCMHCVGAVKKELGKLEISEMEVTIGSARVTYDEVRVSRTRIIQAIEEAGYRVV